MEADEKKTNQDPKPTRENEVDENELSVRRINSTYSRETATWYRDRCPKCAQPRHTDRRDCIYYNKDPSFDECSKCANGFHLTRDCLGVPRDTKLQEQRNQPSRSDQSQFAQTVCFDCGRSGHMYHSCSYPPICNGCGREGHYVKFCPARRSGPRVRHPSSERDARQRGLTYTHGENGRQYDHRRNDYGSRQNYDWDRDRRDNRNHGWQNNSFRPSVNQPGDQYRQNFGGRANNGHNGQPPRQRSNGPNRGYDRFQRPPPRPRIPGPPNGLAHDGVYRPAISSN